MATPTPKTPDVQVLRAKDVEIPLVGSREGFSPEVLKLRADFIAGKKLAAEDLNRLVLESAEGGNGNCNIC
jgi:hypothetical protein